MAKKIEAYTCDTCQRVYSDEIRANRCEQRHKPAATRKIVSSDLVRLTDKTGEAFAENAANYDLYCAELVAYALSLGYVLQEGKHSGFDYWGASKGSAPTEFDWTYPEDALCDAMGFDDGDHCLVLIPFFNSSDVRRQIFMDAKRFNA